MNKFFVPQYSLPFDSEVLHSHEKVEDILGETEVVEVEQTPFFYSCDHDNNLLDTRLMRSKYKT